MLKINKIYNIDCLFFFKRIPDNSIDLVVTDPPYGINYFTRRRKKNTRGTEKGILNDSNNLNFIEKVIKELYRVLKPGHHFYWFGRFDSISKHIPLFEKQGFEIKNVLIWIKNNHGTGDLYYSYSPKYECILYGIKPGKQKIKLNQVNGKKRHPDVLFFDKIPSNILIHDHQKPTDLIEFLIKKSSKKGNLILDPFIGSGQTALAAIIQNRNFIGFELNKNIWKLANKRIKTFLSRNVEILKKFADITNQNFLSNQNLLEKFDGYLIVDNNKFKTVTYEANINNKFEIDIDIVKVFYFIEKTEKLKKRKFITFKEFENLIFTNKIKISEYSNLYKSHNEICLIYINKNFLNKKIKNELNNIAKYQDGEYIYIPIFINDLKNYIENNNKNLKLFFKNKKNNKNAWESLYTKINIFEIIKLKQI